MNMIVFTEQMNIVAMLRLFQRPCSVFHQTNVAMLARKHST